MKRKFLIQTSPFPYEGPFIKEKPAILKTHAESPNEAIANIKEFAARKWPKYFPKMKFHIVNHDQNA